MSKQYKSEALAVVHERSGCCDIKQARHNP